MLVFIHYDNPEGNFLLTIKIFLVCSSIQIIQIKKHYNSLMMILYKKYFFPCYVMKEKKGKYLKRYR